MIRVNSQSGSGGIGYLLEQKYGLAFPREMRLDFMRAIKAASDREHRELSLADVHAVFQKEFLDVFTPIDVVEAHFAQKDGITAYIDVQVNGGPRRKATATGNGPPRRGFQLPQGAVRLSVFHCEIPGARVGARLGFARHRVCGYH